MKLSLFHGALTLLATTQAASISSFHRQHIQTDEPMDVHAIIDASAHVFDGRKLAIDEFIRFFIVSFISEDDAWCITAAEGTEEFGNLKLQPCDFDLAPLNQLWFPSFDAEDYKIRSALDDSKCVTVNHGCDLFEGVRARLADCDNGLTAFLKDYNGQIQVTEDPTFCLTNRGPRPHPTDWIHVKPCIDRADFYFAAIPHVPFLVQLKSGGGCAQPREGSNRVFLDECDESLALRLSFVEQKECALVHSPLDDSMCARAGMGEDIEDGTRLAIVPCDDEDDLQKFCYTPDDQIVSAFDPTFCVVYRGVNANVGVDPIIMIPCNDNDNQDTWEVVELFPY